MQFLVFATDATDDGALNRRMAARDEHVAMISAYREKGNMLIGAARLDDAGKMIGSTIICDFPTREDLDKWLEKEPYLQNNVWDEVKIEACAVGPSFLKN